MPYPHFQKGIPMLAKLCKILVLATCIYGAMLGYETYTGHKISKITTPVTTQQQNTPTGSQGNTSDKVKSSQKVTSGPSLEERKMTKHEKSALKSIFLALVPEKTKWPVPLQKTYQLFNMEDVIDPLRESPNWVRLSSIKRDVPQAVIAIEDHNFYNHGAIALSSIIRAFLTNLSAGEVVEGGSTITQQLVKNVFLSQERTMSRKAEELMLSLMLEHQYSKDEILEMYLNTTYFGAGATGIKQAASKYFAKAPSGLNLAEAAVIAALPYAPSALNPLENPRDCRKRQQLVLQEMQKYGFISQTQYNEAKMQRIHLTNGKNM